MSPAKRSRAAAALIAGTLLVSLLPSTVLAADPVAVDDPLISVAEDSGATALDVLANDSDTDLDILTITDATDPAHGSTTTDGLTVELHAGRELRRGRHVRLHDRRRQRRDGYGDRDRHH